MDVARGLAVVSIGLCGCLASPPDSTAPPGGDGGPEGDGGPPVIDSPCGEPTLVTDNFGDTMALPTFTVAKDPDGTASAAMDGSQAVFDLGVSGFATLLSYRAFNFEGASAFIELTEVPDPATSARFFFIAQYDDETSFQFRLEDGVLYAEYDLPTEDKTVVDMADYDPVAHRWWRLREEGGVLFWEVSADNDNWDQLGQTPVRVPLRYLRILFHASIEDLGEDGGEVHLDNFNGGGAPAGHWCPAATFGQDFDEPPDGEAWFSIDGTGCAINYVDGALQFDLTAGTNGTCSHLARPRFDLTGSSAGVELVEPLDTTDDALAALRLFADSENWLEMRVVGGVLKVVPVVDGVSSTAWEATFVPTVHSLWRIREVDGNVYFEAHDGANWAALLAMANPFDLTAVEVRMSIVVLDDPLVEDRTVRFDNYNLNLPP